MPRRFFLCVLIFTMAVLTAAGRAVPAGKKTRAPRPGGAVDWADEIRFDFEEMPLGEAFAVFAESEGFAFFLDRRVDTELPVTLSVRSVPLLAGMTELAESAGLNAVRIAPSILYVGPAGSCGELLLLTALHRGELSVLETRYTPPKEDGVVCPTDLLKESAGQIGGTWTGLDRMPFDCWRADELASLSYRGLFSLVLIGYGVDYRVEGTKEKPVFKPVRIDRAAQVTRQWPARDTEGIDFDSFGDLTAAAVRDEIRVTGPFESVAKIEYLVTQNQQKREIDANLAARGETREPDRSGAKRIISGDVKQVTLKKLADRLKEELGLEILLDPSLDGAGITMQTRVSCSFRSADARRAVKVIADELGVGFEMNGNIAVLRKE
ncbi:MAG: hypothetical protein IJJ20_06985 [Thermoguttaceae bacterium]|nr:hypothetical protein [Thermoguttaceae bacterium]